MNRRSLQLQEGVVGNLYWATRLVNMRDGVELFPIVLMSPPFESSRGSEVYALAPDGLTMFLGWYTVFEEVK